MPLLPAWPYPLWIAHRGAGRLAPENTLAAFRVGAGHGYRAFEFDVKLSADGVPFLLHDDTLERTTDGQGVAGARAWAELSRLDAGAWHSRGHAGEPLPTLQAISRYGLCNGFAFDVELKPTPGQEAETGAVVAEGLARAWRDAPLPPLLSSFAPAALRSARDAAPQLPRALLLDTLADDWLASVQELGCSACIVRHDLLDAPLVARLHGRGLQALAYTVNDGAEARRLLALGVVGLITDEVARFAPAGTTLA